MDMRSGGGGQESELRSPGSLGFAHLTSRPSPLPERRLDASSIFAASQILDRNQLLQREVSVGRERDPNPDPVSSAPAVPAGSKPKAGSPATVRYRECLKNHAANIGGSVVDGCGEFMPTGEEGTLEALKCAACDCHRNFHRKEVEGETQFSSSCRRRSMMVNPVQLPLPLPSPTSLHHPHHHQFSMGLVPPVNVAFGGGSGGTESSSEDLNAFQSNAEGMVGAPPYAVMKKRSRTKFTPEQKNKMLEFAEKVGWRFQRQDEEEIEKFCREVGVRRQVFKVWMHNNKNVTKKLEAAPTTL